MSLIAIALLLTSALLHTTWNVLLKQAGDKYIATWIATVVGALILIPAVPWVGLPERTTWISLIVSVLAEMMYLILLASAYHNADFSIIYPIARGAAPLFIAIWSLVFFAESLTPHGLLGLVMIITGLSIIGMTSFLQSHPSHLQNKGIVLALLTALCISIYTTIDGHVVKHSAPLAYGLMVLILMPISVTPFILKTYSWATIRNEWSEHGKRLIIIGAILVSAYLLVLFAYSLAPVSYAGAIREVSVVFGAIAGWQFLGEKMGTLRVLGAIIIFTGIITIALLG